MPRRLSYAASFIFACAAWLPLPTAAFAEVCHDQNGQYAQTRTCVSSVLAPQGSATYGPDNLTGGSDGAWCEGVTGPGLGETVTVYQKDGPVIGSMILVNGYAKSSQTFRGNGRVKRARIETSGGFKRDVTLKDSAVSQTIKFAPSRVEWVRLTILEVYSGKRHADTCISGFYFNHEEFGAGG